MSRITRSGSTALLAVVAAATATTAAHAATVTGPGNPGSIVTYTAGAGETNKVKVTAPDSHTIQLVDSGVTAIGLASTGCTHGAQQNVVLCTITDSTPWVDIDLGDGNDTWTDAPSLDAVQIHPTDTPGVIETTSGGDGNDTFTFTRDDLLSSLVGGLSATLGGPGNDNFRGGPGDDEMDGGDGNDLFIGGRGADYMDGGAGTDGVIYSQDGRKTGVYASEASSTVRSGDLAFDAGHVYQGDQLSGIENITGTSYDDVLIGDASNNALTGVGGSDDLRGGAGNDTLTPGQSKPSKLDGGDGDDTLNARDGAVDTLIQCAAGNDVANVDFGIADTPLGCESVVAG